MPRISYFYGITIAMYWDERDHPVAHFHAEYAGSKASIAVDGTVLGAPCQLGRSASSASGLANTRTNYSRTGSTHAATNRSRRSSRCPKLGAMSDVPDLVHVTDVEVIGDYVLRLTFEDGTIGDVSFEDRQWRGVFEPLRDPRRFAEVVVDKQMGTIAWPSGLDMAPEPLYAEARANLAAPSLRP
jgi:hypothetical protein